MTETIGAAHVQGRKYGRNRFVIYPVLLQPYLLRLTVMVLPYTYVIIDTVVPRSGNHLWWVISMTALASVV